MEKVRGKKMQVSEKVGKSRFTVFFQWFVAPEGRKVTSLKRRVRSQLVRWEMKNCTLLWREAHLWVKKVKTPHVRTTFGSCDVEKLHAVVARSTFVSKKSKNTSRSDHFWKLRCRKSARRCGAKHISKSKCTKHAKFGPLLEVEMSKKCMPLWREAHFQVKMYKARQVRTTFGSWEVEKVHAVVAKHISKSICTKHAKFGPLFDVQMPITTTTTATTATTTTVTQQLQLQLQLHHNYNYKYATTTPQYTTLNDTTLPTATTTTTLLYTTLH